MQIQKHIKQIRYTNKTAHLGRLSLVWECLGSFTFEPTSEATQGPQIFAMDEDDSPRRGFIPESSRHGTWAVYGCSEGDTHSFCTKLVSVFCLHHSFLKKKTDNSAYSRTHTHRYHRYIYIYIIYIIYIILKYL